MHACFSVHLCEKGTGRTTSCSSSALFRRLSATETAAGAGATVPDARSGFLLEDGGVRCWGSGEGLWVHVGCVGVSLGEWGASSLRRTEVNSRPGRDNQLVLWRVEGGCCGMPMTVVDGRSCKTTRAVVPGNSIAACVALGDGTMHNCVVDMRFTAFDDGSSKCSDRRVVAPITGRWHAGFVCRDAENQLPCKTLGFQLCRHD